MCESWPTALVVEPTLSDSVFVVGALTGAGYRVTVADFAAAKARLAFSPPDLLVVDIRQGMFNGLHLVIRAQSAPTRVASLVTSKYPDIVLQREAEALGAVFVVKPVSRTELLAAAARVRHRSPETAPQPIRPPFERRLQDRRRAAETIIGPERRRGERRRVVSLAV